MGTTSTKDAAETADTPSARHARHAGLIPGVPLKDQLGINPLWPIKSEASLAESGIGPVSAPLPVASSEDLAEEVKDAHVPSPNGLSKKQKRKLKRKEKKLKQKKKGLKPTLVGSATRTKKAGDQCRLCLMWFQQSALITHWQQCKRSARDRRVACTVCSASFPALEIYSHFRACGRKGVPRSPQAPGTPTKGRSIRPGNGLERVEIALKPLSAREFHDPAHTVPFEILPPGRREIEVLIARLKRRSRNHRHAHIENEYHWERFDLLLSLRPVDHWEGKTAWRGYIAFVFPRTDTVILECARKGNATYLLNGRWQEMISATKAELRSEYRHESRRIFHTAGWESSILQVVSGRRRF